MVIIIVVLTIVVFFVVDLILRLLMRRMEKNRLRREREKALDIGLRLVFNEEANSLKRVEVENPKAKILAVDDEKVVLDSFRKILVIAGYSVDTVETGPEALALIKKYDYDFVFTDLKMPEMDGIEVTKAVKHLRPDIDVIMITGYATVESAVEAMKYGAMDYVQKPFTEDELVDFVNKSLIRRQDRIEKEVKPKIHLVTPLAGESTSEHEFNVPSGIFISPSHLWLIIELNGAVRVGLDDFAQKIIGQIDEVELPGVGNKIKKGDSLFSVKQDDKNISLPSPVSGKILSVNTELIYRTELIKLKPYELGWICRIEPTSLSDDLCDLKIGSETVVWYQKEIDKYFEMIKEMNQERKKIMLSENKTDEKGMHRLTAEAWEMVSGNFFKQDLRKKVSGL